MDGRLEFRRRRRQLIAFGFSHLIAPHLFRRGQVTRTSVSNSGSYEDHELFKILLPAMVLEQPTENRNILNPRNTAFRFIPRIFQNSAENDGFPIFH